MTRAASQGQAALSRLKERILDENLHWEEGLLRSGDAASWMFDLRELLLSPDGLKMVGGLLYERLKDEEIDGIAGVSTAGEPLVIALLHEFHSHGKPVAGLVARQEPKLGTEDAYVEGPLRKGMRVVVVDDAMNAGESMTPAIRRLEEAGLVIRKVFTIIDFREGGYHALRERGYEVESLLTLQDLGLRTRVAINYEDGHVLPLKGGNMEEDAVGSIREEEERLVAYADGLVKGFSGEEESWSYALGEKITIKPLHWKEDLAVVCAHSGLSRSVIYLISLSDGSIRKKLRMGAVSVDPAPHGGGLVVCSDDGIIKLLDEDGYVQWERDMEQAPAHAPVTAKDGKVIVSTKDGEVIALDARGEERWRRHLGSSTMAPVLLEDSLLLTSGTAFLLCLDPAKGKLRWIHELKNEARCALKAGEEIILGCRHGFLVWVDRRDGRMTRCIKAGDGDIIRLEDREGRLELELEDGRRYALAR